MCIRDSNIINWREFIADFLCDGGSLYFNNNAYLLWMIDNQQCKIKEIGYRDQQSLIAALNLAQHIAAREGYAEKMCIRDSFFITKDK